MKHVLISALAGIGGSMLAEVIIKVHNRKFETAIILGVLCLCAAGFATGAKE